MEPYFAFCDYSSTFPHRIIFIPINKLDNYHKLSNQIKEIQKLGPFIIECVVDQELIGYYINGNFDGSDETLKLINYWQFLSDSLDEYDKVPLETISYYVNDENRSLSPIKLYNKILGMTEYEVHTFCVNNCVIVSL